MTSEVHSIGIDAASEGMVLAEDLRDAGGAVLLPAGATLGAAALASLRRRGIERLSVAGAAEVVDEAALAATRERQCARLAQLFRRCLEGPASGASAQLHQRLLDYRRCPP